MPEVAPSISATTRTRRPGEENGREYYFLTLPEFLERIEQNGFLEHVTYVSGHRYGTLRSELDRISGAGRVPLLELETEGALRVKREVPGAVTIFITATVDELTSVVSELKPGTTVELGIETQSGQHKTLHLELGTFPGG